MTSDDQQFLDLLASIPQDMAHYGSRIADYIEKHTNSIASDIRDAIDSTPWFPDSLRPSRHNAGGHHFFAQAPPPPQGMIERTTTFISRNRTTIAVIVAFATTTYVLVHRRRKEHARKRRAKKLRNGGKKEIVVLACSSFHDPLTKSLALDLERRGYIVYITVSTTEEDSLVQAESKPDLRPLWVDLTSSTPNSSIDIHPNLEPIRELIAQSTRSSSPGSVYSAPENLSLAGLVILPGSSGYPADSLINLSPSDLIDTVNTRLLAPVLTVQQFLPLLSNYNQSPHTNPSIILAYPSIPTSLSSPHQIPEVITGASITALTRSLRREIKTAKAGITITELRLGNFDVPNGGRGATPREPSQTQALTHWHSSQRNAAAQARSSIIKGSSARDFHNVVFDALAPPQTYKPFGSARFEWTARKTEGIYYVGSGARFYHVVGAIMPAGLVGWMMGYHLPAGKQGGRGLKMDPSRSDAANAVRNVWGGASASGSGSESGIWEKV